MKKIFLVLFGLIICSGIGYANCPSEAQYRANLHNAVDKKSYLNSVTSGCITYFKSTYTPDCRKVPVLLSAYMTMYNRHSAVYKSEIQGLKNNLSKFCPAEYESVKDIMFK